MPAKKANIFHVCGPKLSMCCSLLSVWGIVMLGILAILLNVHSAGLIEDVHLDEDIKDFSKAIEDGYHHGMINCAGAVGLYAACLIFSLIQVYFNKKTSK